MAKIYVQTPNNWSRITEHIIYSKEECIEKIIRAKKCLILDTCSIIQYANLRQTSLFYAYVHDVCDMILIPRTILMELASDNAEVKEEHLSFLERLNNEKPVYIFDEEWCYTFLKLVFNMTDKELNTILIDTMKAIKTIFSNCVDEFFNNDLQIEKYFKNTPTVEVYTDFFTDMRTMKETGDSLGEELTALVVILLSNIKELKPCKYELLSNDRNSYYSLSSTKKYINNKYKWDAFMCRTTCNLAYLLYKNEYMNYTELKEFVSVSYVNSELRCFAAGQNDLECKEYCFSVNDFVKMLENDNLFKVIY